MAQKKMTWLCQIGEAINQTQKYALQRKQSEAQTLTIPRNSNRYCVEWERIGEMGRISTPAQHHLHVNNHTKSADNTVIGLIDEVRTQVFDWLCKWKIKLKYAIEIKRVALR